MSVNQWLAPFFNANFQTSNLVSLDWWIALIQANPSHFAIEIVSLAIIVYLLNRKPYDPREHEKLSLAEEEELIRTWVPQPIARALPVNAEARKIPVIEKYVDQYCYSDGKKFVNFGSSNFLSLAGHPTITEAVTATINSYGVGSCGPRGFYGTFDIHLELEKTISQFYGAEAAILYSDTIGMMASVIPAFSKRGDLIVCDEAVNFGIQQGIKLSRSNVLYYKHGDMNDLERILQQVDDRSMGQSNKKLVRCFIICEGLSSRFGDLAPVGQLIRLKNKYKYRLILDDSLGFGVLGANGRGSLEHANVSLDQCELYCTSLDCSMASVGGVCMGNEQIVAHQRLSGSGYCFSASSPPYTSKAAVEAIQLMRSNPKWVQHVRDNALYMRRALDGANISSLSLLGGVDTPSPLIHLSLSPAYQSTTSSVNELMLLKVLDDIRDTHSMLVSVPEFIEADRDSATPPTLAIQVTRAHTKAEMDKLVKAIKDAAQKHIKQ